MFILGGFCTNSTKSQKKKLKKEKGEKNKHLNFSPLFVCIYVCVCVTYKSFTRKV